MPNLIGNDMLLSAPLVFSKIIPNLNIELLSAKPRDSKDKAVCSHSKHTLLKKSFPGGRVGQ